MNKLLKHNLNLQDFIIPPNCTRIYTSDITYKDYFDLEEYEIFDKKIKSRSMIHRTNGPAYISNYFSNEGYDLYAAFKINGLIKDGLSRVWFKNEELLSVEYYFNNKHCYGIMTDKEYSDFLKTQVFT